MKRAIRFSLLVLAATTTVVYAQAPRQLKVEVGPNQQIWITASDVTYGEVLQALQEKLGCEIDIPPAAGQQRVSSVKVENKQPQEAFAELFAGSKLGFAFLGGNGSPITKVIVTPSGSSESTPAEASTPVADEAGNASSSPSTTPSTPAGTSSPSAPSTQADAGPVPQPSAPEKLSLSEAANAVGVPPGVSPDSVGKATTFSMSDAAAIMGVPPGLSPSDVGQTKILPLSEAAAVVGVPPGASPDNIGRTISLPLTNGAGPSSGATR